MKHKFTSLFIATSIALFSHAASADPSQYTHRNGAVVVDINTANANGISHNMWKQFDVSQKGMILNNATSDIIKSSGNISKNKNLTDAAKVILNEVISNKASSLNGFIEVAGQKADVIVANPNGINCSGCSFINAARVTMTTGTPIMAEDGNLTGFKVNRGKITVSQKGLANEGFTELLANSIQLNGIVKSSGVKAIAGNFTYDISTQQATADEKAVNAVIDVQSLGGVTANTIFLGTTHAGTGVNNQGVLNGQLIQISSGGKLTNTGTIASTYGTTITAKDSIENKASGKVNSMSNITMLSEKSVMNDGAVESVMGNINLYAVPLTPSENLIEVIWATLFGSSTGDITNRGDIRTGGSLSVTAAKNLRLEEGKVEAGETMQLIGGANVYNGTSVQAKDINLLSTSFENRGTVLADNNLSVDAEAGISNYKTLQAGSMQLKTDGDIVNEECGWFHCTAGTIKAHQLTINAPKLTSIFKLKGNIEAPSIQLNVPTQDKE